MARKNPKIVELEEKLRRANLKAENEQELKFRAQGKLEKYEEAEEKERDTRHMMVREREEYTRKLEDQVAWMRRFMEFMCIPKDKLVEIQKLNEKIEITNQGYPPRY